MAAFVEKTLCRGCGVCNRVCPVGAITLDRGTATVNSEKCTDCGACVQACPFGAITVERTSAAQTLRGDWGHRGMGRGYRPAFEQPPAGADSLEALREQAARIREQLKFIEQRIAQLSKH